MKELIVNSNDWYVNLKEPVKSLVYLIIILLPLFILTHFGYGWCGMGWIALVIIWRILYPIFK